MAFELWNLVISFLHPLYLHTIWLCDTKSSRTLTFAFRGFYFLLSVNIKTYADFIASAMDNVPLLEYSIVYFFTGIFAFQISPSRFCSCIHFYPYVAQAKLQGVSNMTGTNCDLFTHNQSRSYLNHLVYTGESDKIKILLFGSKLFFFSDTFIQTWRLWILPTIKIK
jgi:hypothetical protein